MAETNGVSNYKIRGVFWGMKMHEVERLEQWGKSDIQYDYRLRYTGKILHRECTLEYYFSGLTNEDRRLKEIIFYFRMCKDKSADTFLYGDLKDVLTTKYGKELRDCLEERIMWIPHEEKTCIQLYEGPEDGEDCIIVYMTDNIKKDGGHEFADRRKQSLGKLWEQALTDL